MKVCSDHRLLLVCVVLRIDVRRLRRDRGQPLRGGAPGIPDVWLAVSEGAVESKLQALREDLGLLPHRVPFFVGRVTKHKKAETSTGCF